MVHPQEKFPNPGYFHTAVYLNIDFFYFELDAVNVGD